MVRFLPLWGFSRPSLPTEEPHTDTMQHPIVSASAERSRHCLSTTVAPTPAPAVVSWLALRVVACSPCLPQRASEKLSRSDLVQLIMVMFTGLRLKQCW